MESSFSFDSISLRGAGVVMITQLKSGPRFTLDSLLLADFCQVKDGDRILEPGAGTGIISLLLAKKYSRSRIVSLELQSTLASLCRTNIQQNRLERRIRLIEGDLRMLKQEIAASALDLIVANPPYTKTGSGKNNPLRERLASRQDRYGDLDAWLDLQRYLKNKGRYALVFPARRLAELITSLRAHRLEPKRMRLVHPTQNKPASLVLVEAVKSAGSELQVLPPLIVHDAAGGFTREIEELYDNP